MTHATTPATFVTAVKNAAAGDTLILADGNYPATTLARPLTLLAANQHKAMMPSLVLTSAGALADGLSSDGWGSGEAITHTSGGQAATAAYRIEADNCEFRNCKVTKAAGTGIGVIGRNNPRIWRKGCRLTNCIASYCGRNGIAWSFTDGLVVKDCENANNNTKKLVSEWESSSKAYITTNTLIDGGRWHHNAGPGAWFDYQNHNFVVRNAEFFANAAWSPGSPWAGPGLAIEISAGPGLIENCWFHDSSGGKGLAIWESENLIVRNCKFDGASIQIRDNANRPPYRLRNIRVEGCELFGGTLPTHPAIVAVGTILASKAGPPRGWLPTTTPTVLPATPNVAAATPNVASQIDTLTAALAKAQDDLRSQSTLAATLRMKLDQIKAICP